MTIIKHKIMPGSCKTLEPVERQHKPYIIYTASLTVLTTYMLFPTSLWYPSYIMNIHFHYITIIFGTTRIHKLKQNTALTSHNTSLNTPLRKLIATR